MFCGVLWCFAVFCVRVFSVFFKLHKTDQQYIQNAQNEQNTLWLCAIQRNTVLRIFLSLRKCQMTTQNIRKTRPKSCKTHAKTPQNTVFHKTHATHHKTPAKHKTQNTAKHHKTHLLTKQTELPNKPLRSHHGWVNPIYPTREGV